MANINTIILAISLIIIMFGMGLSLTVDDFKQILIKPKAIIGGLISQLILLPAIGFALILLFPAPAEISIGIIILAACPGGPTSNLITHLAKGDTALSVSLTAICSFITLLTIPFVINLGLQIVLGANTVIQLNTIQTIAQVFIIVIIPVVIGMTIKAKRPSFSMRMEAPVRKASAVVFVLVMIGIMMKERANLVAYIQAAGSLALALNVLTMITGYGIGKLLKLSLKQQISISIESGIQNGTLAISIATVLLNNSAYAIAPAVYGILMFLTGGLVVFWFLARRAT